MSSAEEHRRKCLADIPVMPLDALQRLAAMAPAEAQTSEPAPPVPPKKTTGSRAGSDLGPVDVGKYLLHYGVDHDVKQDGERTLYRLPACLFNPDHRREASIIQTAAGAIYYQCFHTSCKGFKWEDARRRISGEDSLAPFCGGYDPDWKPPAPKPPPPIPGAQSGGRDNPPRDFVYENDQGRLRINTAKLADYIEAQHAPMIHEGRDFGDVFYRYDGKRGVWRLLPDAQLCQVARRELGDLAKGHHVDESIKLLKYQTFKGPDEIAPAPMMLNLKSGMLDLATMEMRPHAAEYHSRVQLPVSYNPDAKCPLWDQTLDEVFAEQPEKAYVLQQFAGYCLYPRILFPCAMFCIGGGGNGKGMIEDVLCAMLGYENVSHISMARMQKDFGPIEIRNKLLNSCGETEAGALDVTNFKKIAAGDMIQAEVKYKGDVKFRPIAKHFISMNAFPGLKEKTKSFFRRIIVLEFKQTFEGDKVDVYRFEKLKQELDGIFMWALEGLKWVLETQRILVPESVEQAKQRFREKVNPVLTFVDEECVLQAGAQITPPDLYRHYKAWCDDGGNKPLAKSNFYEQIALNFDSVVKTRPKDSSKWVYSGIGLAALWGVDAPDAPLF